MSTVRGYFVDAINRKAQELTAEDTLESWYKIINCDTIDITCRRIGEEVDAKYFNFICDDEGLLKGFPTVTAISSDNQPMLVGNLFICNDDGEGNLTSLSDDDISIIEKNIKTVVYETPHGKRKCNVCLINCNY